MITAVLLAFLWVSGINSTLLAANEPDALGEPLTDEEVRHAVRDYLANSPDAKEWSWIAASGKGLEKLLIVHQEPLEAAFWGPWQVTPKTGEALLMTKDNARILKAVIRRRDGKAAIVSGQIWHYLGRRVTIDQVRSSPKK